MAIYEEFTIDQGSDVAIQLDLIDDNGSPKNLNNTAIIARMKKNYNVSNDSATSFTGTIIDPASNGIATISLTNAQTNALKPGRYVYDVELYFKDSNNVSYIERILEGRIQVTPSVS
jgi:hypothetical protein